MGNRFKALALPEVNFRIRCDGPPFAFLLQIWPHISFLFSTPPPPGEAIGGKPEKTEYHFPLMQNHREKCCKTEITFATSTQISG